MSRPIGIPNSRFLYARKVVPKELRAIVGRTEFKRPLHGETHADIQRLHAQALAEWNAILTAARAKLNGKLRTLTAREVDHICGDWYRAQVAEHEDEPGCEEGGDCWLDALIDRVACV